MKKQLITPLQKLINKNKDLLGILGSPHTDRQSDFACMDLKKLIEDFEKLMNENEEVK